MFENSDVRKIDLGSISSFYRRQDIWVVYFYNPKLEECKRFKDDFIKAADKLYGIITVGAIDCLSEEELCEEFGVFDVPQIVIFTENINDDGEEDIVVARDLPTLYDLCDSLNAYQIMELLEDEDWSEDLSAMMIMFADRVRLRKTKFMHQRTNWEEHAR